MLDDLPSNSRCHADPRAGLKLTGVESPALVANVGDTTSDLESAARAGVRWNVGVLSGAHTREALERAPHTHIIQSVQELLAVL